MKNRLYKKVNFSHLCLGFETLYYLVKAKFCVSFCRFESYLRHEGRWMCESLKDPSPDEPQAKRLAYAIQKIALYLPWQSVCLDKAIALQRMLKKRKISHTVYFGMRRKEQGEWQAHAWVRVASHDVIGNYQLDSYAIVAMCAILID